MWVALLSGVALIVASLGFIGFWAYMGGALLDRRHHQPASQDGPSHRFVFLVPALNEQRVIAETVKGLLSHDANVMVYVIDDASTDSTAKIIKGLKDKRVRLVQRQLPNAQIGKGAALNEGFRRILADLDRQGADAEDVLIGVMDADGRLSEDALPAVSAMFADSDVGGVQLGVRIRNRQSFIGRLQDFEFWAVTPLAQLGRNRTGSVSLGGNGQFTRLSALLALGEDPWRERSLTEDLDLSISLAVMGWKLASPPSVFVSQQGVEKIRPLLRQRTRWFQGHITASRRTTELWRSPRVRNGALIETSFYLLSPILLVIPWSLLFPFALWNTAMEMLAVDPAPVFGSEILGRAVATAPWYFVSFGPTLFTGFVYWRRAQDVSLGQAMWLAHVIALPFAFVPFTAVWRAAIRQSRSEVGWVKTERSVETSSAA